LDEETVKAILKEFRINNAQIVIRTTINADEMIDVIEANKKYIPAITLLNKSDLVSTRELNKIKKKIKADIHVSGETGTNINELKELIFQKLKFIRIYTKESRKKADLKAPLIMKIESTIRDVCTKLHRDFVKKFKYSKVWGNSAKFGGQKFGLDHTVADGDVVEIHIT